MIFWQLFYTFCKIGIFNFGGGYAMISLIQNEVVIRHGWMTAQEFTDIVAVSQMTPGPIGINVATYAGYTATLNAGYAPWAAICGSFLASFSVILLPFILMLIVSNFLIKHRDNEHVKNIFSILKITIVGLIAAAALTLATPENFGTFSQSPCQFIASLIIFATAFIAAHKFRISPILLIVASGVIGLLLYQVMPILLT